MHSIICTNGSETVVFDYRSINLSLCMALALSSTAAFAGTKQLSPFANLEEKPTQVVHAGNCEVRCVDAHTCSQKGDAVIALLNKLIAAYSQGDLKTYEKYLDDNCSM